MLAEQSSKSPGLKSWRPKLDAREVRDSEINWEKRSVAQSDFCKDKLEQRCQFWRLKEVLGINCSKPERKELTEHLLIWKGSYLRRTELEVLGISRSSEDRLLEIAMSILETESRIEKPRSDFLVSKEGSRAENDLTAEVLHDVEGRRGINHWVATKDEANLGETLGR